MSITKEAELLGMQNAAEAVAYTLKEMQLYASPGMSTLALDLFGGETLKKFGARSAPHVAYKFPGWTCISVNHEFCHGIPSANKILQEGDLINIDVSAELNGYWADNGNSFVIGNDHHNFQPLIKASKEILHHALQHIRGGIKISTIGHLMETEAKKRGYKVIKNLGGHGIGRNLHEQPEGLLNYKDPFDHRRFKKNDVVAIETFIATTSTLAVQQPDGWTMIGNKGGFMAQHEHTIVITDHLPIILTASNNIFH
jgi:methionyl aminopeptidase